MPRFQSIGEQLLMPRAIKSADQVVNFKEYIDGFNLRVPLGKENTK